MNCETCQNEMMDILYGEEVAPRQAFLFFQHLGECERCQGEYLELVETRERLAEWEVPAPRPQSAVIPWPARAVRALTGAGWWRVAQRVAALLLMLAGVAAILQAAGFLGGRRLLVSEPQLTRMVQDMIVDQQIQERRRMLEALLQVKEDLELEQRQRSDQVQRYLISLEQKYVNNLEENNQYLRRLLSR